MMCTTLCFCESGGAVCSHVLLRVGRLTYKRESQCQEPIASIIASIAGPLATVF